MQSDTADLAKGPVCHEDTKDNVLELLVFPHW